VKQAKPIPNLIHSKMTAIFSINDENESAVFDPPPDPPIALPP